MSASSKWSGETLPLLLGRPRGPRADNAGVDEVAHLLNGARRMEPRPRQPLNNLEHRNHGTHTPVGKRAEEKIEHLRFISRGAQDGTRYPMDAPPIMSRTYGKRNSRKWSTLARLLRYQHDRSGVCWITD